MPSDTPRYHSDLPPLDPVNTQIQTTTSREQRVGFVQIVIGNCPLEMGEDGVARPMLMLEAEAAIAVGCNLIHIGRIAQGFKAEQEARGE